FHGDVRRKPETLCRLEASPQRTVLRNFGRTFDQARKEAQQPGGAQSQTRSQVEGERNSMIAVALALILYGMGAFVIAVILFSLWCLGGDGKIQSKKFGKALLLIFGWPVVLPLLGMLVLIKIFNPTAFRPKDSHE